MVAALVLETSGEIRGGSNPFVPTKVEFDYYKFIEELKERLEIIWPDFVFEVHNLIDNRRSDNDRLEVTVEYYRQADNGGDDHGWTWHAWKRVFSNKKIAIEATAKWCIEQKLDVTEECLRYISDEMALFFSRHQNVVIRPCRQRDYKEFIFTDDMRFKYSNR